MLSAHEKKLAQQAVRNLIKKGRLIEARPGVFSVTAFGLVADPMRPMTQATEGAVIQTAVRLLEARGGEILRFIEAFNSGRPKALVGPVSVDEEWVRHTAELFVAGFDKWRSCRRLLQ